MTTASFAKSLSYLVLLPGIAGLGITVLFGASQSPIAGWFNAHWWQLFLGCAAAHGLLRMVSHISGRRSRRA